MEPEQDPASENESWWMIVAARKSTSTVALSMVFIKTKKSWTKKVMGATEHEIRKWNSRCIVEDE